MPQLAQRFGLDLPDALTGHLKVLPDFLKGVVGGLANPEPLPQDFFFPRGQRFQRTVDLALQIVPNRGFQRRDRLLIFDEITQMTVFFFTDRRLQRNRLTRDLENLPDLIERQVHPFGNFLR